jgi:hypothetical protein
MNLKPNRTTSAHDDLNWACPEERPFFDHAGYMLSGSILPPLQTQEETDILDDKTVMPSS